MCAEAIQLYSYITTTMKIRRIFMYSIIPLLQKESKGDILISLAYNSKRCTLDGMILKVTNLEKQDVSGLAGLSFNLYLMKCSDLMQ